MSADVLDRPDTTQQGSADGGDHERFAHYVDSKHGDWEAGYFSGAQIVALCGKQWVPSRDPGRFPVCPDCQAVIDGLPE